MLCLGALRAARAVRSLAAPSTVPPGITMVKKLFADGTPCRKCEQVAQLLERDGHTHRITHTVIAAESDPESPGQVLARKWNVDTAPFFVVNQSGAEKLYTMYFQLKKDVLEVSQGQTEAEKAKSEKEELKEIMSHNSVDLL
eukprot:TRINITY_DN2543_c0_g1_i1.p1 TRINITY_DN2543_c0_g1~~TRINITY_DN2543_c0_g1_i1.p1  ORF type:complete len:151 (+),score=37.61 TRINITY_DN2543_c0_g1_i1:29-454(+)